MEILKNEMLQIVVSEHGAELQSIQDAEGKEYLWQADPKYWGRHSPILFPIVCGLWDDCYRLDGYEYKMARHGFARDMDFKLINKTDTKVTFALEDSPETHRCYPYHFMLSITYRLDGNKIHVIWHVHNTDNNEIHFQIRRSSGIHNSRNERGRRAEGHRLLRQQGQIGTADRQHEGCIIPGRFDVGSQDGIWHFTEESFKEDCVIIDKSQVKQVALLDEDGQPSVTVDMKTPCVGIWAPYGKHAPFVCIEPWYGIHDKVEYRGDFRKKYLMNHLQPGASFLSEYTIAIK